MLIAVGKPALPKGIRVSPDGMQVAVLYVPDGLKWTVFAFDDQGAILQLALLDPVAVEGWTEWNPAE
jgi:hypothetical protein